MSWFFKKFLNWRYLIFACFLIWGLSVSLFMLEYGPLLRIPYSQSEMAGFKLILYFILSTTVFGFFLPIRFIGHKSKNDLSFYRDKKGLHYRGHDHPITIQDVFSFNRKYYFVPSAFYADVLKDIPGAKATKIFINKLYFGTNQKSIEFIDKYLLDQEKKASNPNVTVKIILKHRVELILDRVLDELLANGLLNSTEDSLYNFKELLMKELNKELEDTGIVFKGLETIGIKYTRV